MKSSDLICLIKILNVAQRCHVVVLLFVGANMSVSQHVQAMCPFKFPLKATGSFSMRGSSEINSKYLCTASKGAYIADGTSSNKYW